MQHAPAVQEILKSLPVYMMVGIVVIIAIAQANRIVGGALGAVFWAVVAFVGGYAYEQGGGIGIPGVQFSQPVFYLMCAAFCGMHLFTAWAALRRRRDQRAAQRFVDDGDEEDDATER